ncbi:MAG: hypothetical protein A2X28_02840 [Elusimicrobia bacterium GWA2_56_46]|nr:MAG: hypothetical protein A2X28_02840 [Elusimicrobia bacterium GWA2_56_46]OGR54486.1 MAG: hypothetical protein A2X39_04275 [Elusimicrobia bacterium GWC2_56_31]HBW22542.1 ferritin [Elusimicrobiota bacterium]
MPNKKIEAMLNKQMNAEFYNSHLYLAMAGWFESQNLTGFARWMEIQAEEERGHALRFYKHLKERRAAILVAEVPAVPIKYKSPLEAVTAAFNHEVHVSQEINKMLEAANSEKDFAAAIMLQWFVNEQVEEEAQTDAIVQQLKMAGESKGGLMQIDHHLGKRKDD